MSESLKVAANNTRQNFQGLIPPAEGLGIIKALEQLAVAMGKQGTKVIKLDAGLPNHKRPPEVQQALRDYAEEEYGPYSRYPNKKEGDGKDPISEGAVLDIGAQYHTKITGVETSKERIVLTEGSTPALNHYIRMMAMQKARTDGKRLGEGCALEIFQLSYPLYELPAKDVGVEISDGIKLNTQIDVQDGMAVQSKSWSLNKESLRQSFETNRDKVTTFVFSDPANPSGYKLSKEETDFVAEELLKDFHYRKAHGVAAKMVIQDIAYLTMRKDNSEKPYLLVHAFDKMIEAEHDETRKQELRECRETILTVHSLSKAAGLPGDRVAYTEGNPELVNALRESYTRDMLSYSNASLHIAKACFEAGINGSLNTNENQAIMQEYGKRVDTFERGANAGYFNLLAEKELKLTKEEIRATMPFPNQSGGSFFTVMNMKPLVGQPVSQEFVQEVKDSIAQIPNEGIRNTFGEVFKNGIINESDLPLYFMFRTQQLTGTALSAVPLKDGTIRISVGDTHIPMVQEAVRVAQQFFEKDETYLEGIRAMCEKKPETEVGVLRYVIDKVTHFVHEIAA